MILSIAALMLLFEPRVSPSSLDLETRIFQYIDDHQNEFIENLKDWVAVKSDSIQAAFRKEVTQMMELAADRLRALGASVMLVNQIHQLPDGQSLPVVLAELGQDPHKPTVCFYGHVDVQPAKKEDGWKTDPYMLTEIDGNLYGRGATDNKGPVLAWINAVETFRALKLVECGKKDLHSGTFGGIIHEPMTDLVALLDSLVNMSGHILIPGIYDDVATLTEEEKKLYESVEFDLEEHKTNAGVKKFLYDTKEEILLHLWRYPCVSIHGIEGAFYEPGIKTVIPAKVIGKFSIRQVPHMALATVEKQVTQYLEEVFSKRNSPNKLKVSMPMSTMPWIADINNPMYVAARRAIKTVFGREPDMIRDGSTIPIARMFQNETRKSVMMLPIGAADDGEHSQNEKISRYNYIWGTKLFAAFFLEISKLHGQLQEASNTTSVPTEEP
ncbi:PREDICTED: beta-Ala-His dipeptidase isoform X4 [Gavialis gangeticus]|uniref:beta-Ala-His dipeptidase isoform X4 n=1 Tax=Gavialis gangeticus TaxID=94835 RepID=UPI00092F7EF8|nr:PREDICTED: beta-Ala-His dipeptidase isoform X4 [Gavialis gangeticus]